MSGRDKHYEEYRIRYRVIGLGWVPLKDKGHLPEKGHLNRDRKEMRE